MTIDSTSNALLTLAPEASVSPADAEALYRELQGCVPSAQRIGVVKAYRGGKRIFLR